MSTVAMYDRVSQSVCMYYLIESCKHARNSPPKKGLVMPKILCARTCTEAGSAETALTAGLYRGRFQMSNNMLIG